MLGSRGTQRQTADAPGSDVEWTKRARHGQLLKLGAGYVGFTSTTSSGFCVCLKTSHNKTLGGKHTYELMLELRCERGGEGVK